MSEISQSFRQAFELALSGDPALTEVIVLSLQVTLSAVALATVVGVPLGAVLAQFKFFGRGALTVVLTAAMGLPPVVVGLVLYLLFSQSGPIAPLELLYTPTAMVIAQFILVLPIIATITRTVVIDAHAEFSDMLLAMRANRLQQTLTLLTECRPALTTAVLAGLGRATAEVGAVMIVGGNINHLTRVMTTSIALETSKGELAMALALGLVLLTITLCLSLAIIALRGPQFEVSRVR